MHEENSIFTNFKVHTQYSICEGAIKIEDLAVYCKKNKPIDNEIKKPPITPE